MFDIGWSELVLIGVVALIAIGPKELPGVLRMVGQWMGKARKMAAEFQGQFQEAMREAEMADLKKSFDEVKEAASGFAGNNLMTSLQKDVSDALRVDALDKPTETSATAAIEAPTTSGEAPATSTEAPATSTEAPVTPTTPEAPTPATFVEAETHAAASEPPAITREVEQAQVTQTSVTQDTAPAEAIKDAKAS
ncbi:twin-arginine translocase subunit TatB [Bradyrhizobium sp. CSA207]|uniref:Sec-independent protein translocase protein TatB n=1 Tax=Bradyrhizobium sp. CSA207 TaxID=2698826 RepID=UPI0023AF9403|nr:Sec-independent protein translocase protein TatB [Bradyrhizobium sp. CSA207]MDE5443377.1 twin-arginine translocase subunit TatB [Bradyrhizobium sp. CSA207]